MNQRDWILSVDVGSSSVKAAVFDQEARLLAEKSFGYPLLQPRPGWVEQEAGRVLEAFHLAVKHVLLEVEKKPRVLVLSTAMHSLLGIGRDEQPVTNFITWADQRAEALAQTGLVQKK